MFHALNTRVGLSVACTVAVFLACVSLSACGTGAGADESSFDTRIETIEPDLGAVDVNQTYDGPTGTDGVNTDDAVPDGGDVDVTVRRCTDDSYCPGCPVGAGLCGDFLDCIVDCDGGGDEDACVSACGTQLGMQGTTVLVNLIQCGTDNACLAAGWEGGTTTCDATNVFIALPAEPDAGCFDVECLRSNCRDTYTGCFSGCEIRSCSALDECIGECSADDPLTTPDEHQACVWAGCRRKACPEAQAKYDAWMDMAP